MAACRLWFPDGEKQANETCSIEIFRTLSCKWILEYILKDGHLVWSIVIFEKDQIKKNYNASFEYKQLIIQILFSIEIYIYIYIYVHIKDKFNKIIYIKNNRFYFNSKKNEEEENKIYLRVNEKILFHDLIGLLKFCNSWKQFHQLITISKSDNCHICIICITIILRMISITFRGTNNRSNTAN